MPVLRDRSLTAHHRGDSNIAVSCPRCGSEINVSMFSGDKPIRCDACFYPLLTRGDLLPFVSACEQVSNSDAQCVNLAAHILSKLSETVPEAAMAMNRLVNRMPFTTVSEFERFSALVNAYAAGSTQAQDMLDKMCLSNPKAYQVQVCKNCGAKKYFEKTADSKVRCVYCQSED